MAMFVHLTRESRIKQIRRQGIRRLRKPRGEVPGGIYAVPVTPNFYISHQWLRELKRWGGGEIVGVYFRIPDDERVWCGRYGWGQKWMTAAEAAAAFMSPDTPQGWEVVIPRSIDAGEIHRIRHLPQTVGWRYSPKAHGNRPMACECCQKGLFRSRQIREEDERRWVREREREERARQKREKDLLKRLERMLNGGRKRR